MIIAKTHTNLSDRPNHLHFQLNTILDSIKNIGKISMCRYTVTVSFLLTFFTTTNQITNQNGIAAFWQDKFIKFTCSFDCFAFYLISQKCHIFFRSSCVFHFQLPSWFHKSWKFLHHSSWLFQMEQLKLQHFTQPAITSDSFFTIHIFKKHVDRF